MNILLIIFGFLSALWVAAIGYVLDDDNYYDRPVLYTWAERYVFLGWPAVAFGGACLFVLLTLQHNTL